MFLITEGKSNIKYILIVLVLAVVAGGAVLAYHYLLIKDLEVKLAEISSQLPLKPITDVSAEKACIDSGGEVSTALCCETTKDFPNLCLVGACGCSPENSHQVKICDCGADKCFAENECLPLPVGFLGEEVE